MLLIIIFFLLLPAASSHELTFELSEETITKIEGFIEGKDTVFVIGKYASKTERLVLKAIQERYPQIKDKQLFSESEIEDHDLQEKTVIYIGGPNQNSAAARILVEYGSEEIYVPFGVVHMVESETGRALVISDNAGHSNLPKTSPHNSPLARIMPVGFVPAAASAIGLGLIWSWKFIAMLAKKILRLVLSSKIMGRIKKKDLKDRFIGIRLRGVRLKLREWIAIFLAAAAFALAASYSYLNSIVDLVSFVAVNIGVNMLIYAIRHFTRLVMDKKHKLHTEYVFWIWGTIVVVITGWLGNTFCLAGYTVSEKNKKTAYEAKIVYMIEILTFAAAIVLLLWNLIFPSVIAQMASVLALSLAFFQTLPFSPFGGRKVYRWSRLRWSLLFVPIAALYILTQIWI